MYKPALMKLWIKLSAAGAMSWMVYWSPALEIMDKRLAAKLFAESLLLWGVIYDEAVAAGA